MRLNDLSAPNELRATTGDYKTRTHAALRRSRVFAVFVTALLLGACGVTQNSEPYEQPAAATLDEQALTADSNAASASQAAGALQRLAYIKTKQSSADARYAAKHGQDHIEAANPRQALSLEFRREGVSLKRLDRGASAGAASSGVSDIALDTTPAVEMRWSGLGRGTDISPIESASEPSVDAKEIHYERQLGGVRHREWYLNGPLGLEQGFEVAARPAGEADPLVLEISFEGAELSLAADGRSVALRTDGGQPQLRYSDLFVLDANGELLSSEMRVVGDRVQLRIDDQGAVYPLHIDPLLWQPDGLLSPLDSFSNDNEQLGRATSISGDTVIVGAPNDSDLINEAGSAWVYRFDGSDWLFEQTLTAPDAADGDHFGDAVSVDGDVALVAAPDHDGGASDTGQVYVFARNGTQWSFVTSLSASDGAAGDRFGQAIQLRAQSAIIGTPQQDAAGTDSGAAYVFVENGGNWTEQAKITAWDASPNAHFGSAVDLIADRVIVGAPDGSDAGIQSGGAYLFTRAAGSWSAESKLVAADASADDRFGWAVSLTTDRAFIGAPEKDDGSVGQDAGAAYIFAEAGGWAQEEKLLPVEAGAMFGYSLSAAGDFVGVGAPLQADSGRVSLYQRMGSNWSLTTTNNLNNNGTRFGHSVNVTAAHMIVGAPLEQRVGVASGSAYVYQYDANNSSQMDQLLVEPARDSRDIGNAVAVRGAYVAVGQKRTANGFAAAAGYVLIYKRENGSWHFQTTITHPVATNGTFGSSLSMTDDRLLVGNQGWQGGGNNYPGAAVVFRRENENWIEEAVLPAPADASASGYGQAVALVGERALVGDFVRRRAHVYVRNGQNWTEEDIITSPYPTQTTFFGRAVALSEDTALIGASVESITHNNGGAAYVYARNGSNWVLQQRLEASDGDSNFYFGGRVALSGDRALIGASRARIQNAMNMTVDFAGAAYVFERTGTNWSQTAKLSASDGASGDSFSAGLAIQGDHVAIGAPGHSTPLGGALYFFEESGGSWSQTGKHSVPSAQNAVEFGIAVGLDGGILVAGAPDYRFSTAHRGAAFAFITSELGDPCNTDASCDSGFCADGVCCNSACGGSTDDCQACSGALTGGDDGTCALALAGSICRHAQGLCDAAELCDGSSGECPADIVLPANTSCRAAVSVCDVEETCNGMLAACPADVVAPAGAECRAAAGACDSAEVCDGSGGECPADMKAVAGSECRAAAGLCDIAEMCDGNSDDCPTDDKAAAGSECRAAVGLCDVAEVCDGNGDDCPLDAVVSAGSECRVAAGVCDVAEQCDGSNGVCPSDLKRDATSECRPAAGDCDQAEMCDGSTDDCPADANAADGTLCDDGDRCTAPDSCQAGSCEGQNICGEGGMGGAGGNAQGGAGGAGGMGMGGMAGAGQGGAGDGGAGDGGNGNGGASNGGGTDDIDSGCSCRAAAPPAKPQPMLWWAFGVGVILIRRRRKLQP